MGAAQAILNEKLAFDGNGVPYAEHADIIGWYEEQGREDNDIKHHWKSAAQKVAAKFPYEAR